MIDQDGFRFNVGIILASEQNKLFWGQRIGQNAWQFPQGGLREGEPLQEALYRELHEEIGLSQSQVTWLGETKDWLYYRLPKKLIRTERQPLCIGQKQKWVALRLATDEANIVFDQGDTPEFESWRWVSYWYPLREVVNFKRDVYRLALKELAPVIFAKAPQLGGASVLDPFTFSSNKE